MESTDTCADLVGLPADVPHDAESEERGPLANLLMSAHLEMSTATGRLFDLIARMEDTEMFLPTYSNAAAWLRWNLGVNAATARNYVQMSRGLRDLPATAAAVSEGRLSLDRLRLLLRVAEPDTEFELVEFAVTCADVDTLRERIVDIETAVLEADTAEDDTTSPPSGPQTTMFWRDDTLHLRATVPGVDGATVEQAFLRLGNIAPKEPDTGLFRHSDDRLGEALLQMASESLAADGDHDRATVVIHVAAEDLVTRSGTGWDNASRLFGADDLDRLVCDARIQPSVDDPNGVTIGVGRITRSIPQWLVRMVQGRDQGCRFPGCDQTRWLHGHHIIHWINGGPTNLDNLISLCGFHHRMIHNQNWTIRGNPNGELTFFNKWGHEHTRPSDPFPDGWTDMRDRHIDQNAGQRRRQFAMSGNPP